MSGENPTDRDPRLARGRVRVVPRVETEPPQVLAPIPEDTSTGATEMESMQIAEIGELEQKVVRRDPRPPPNMKDFLKTREPDKAKWGKSGGELRLRSNYFILEHRGNEAWKLLQYRVDFKPEIVEVNTKMKKALVRKVGDKLPSYIFDGTLLFCGTELKPEQQCLESEFEGDKYEIYIRHVGHVENFSVSMFQFYNILLRKAIQGMGLQEIGRNHYDENQKIVMRAQRIELWPGVVTSIRRHENNVLLNMDVSMKLLHLETVLDVIRNVQYRREYSENQKMDQINREVCGKIVMTRFNRKTYKVESIVWNTSAATETFSTTDSNGQQRRLTIEQYFRDRHQITLKDPKAPLLNIKLTKQMIRRGITGDQKILLPPELCFVTGLSETERQNFQLMRALAQHLHMDPTSRVETITTFFKRLASIETVKEEMRGFGTRFSDLTMAAVKGRRFTDETLMFGGGDTPAGREYLTQKQDWQQAFRDQQMLSCNKLAKWVIICPQRNVRNVDQLIRTMQRVSRSMGYDINQPELHTIQRDDTMGFAKGVDDVCAKHRHLNMIMAILPNDGIETYSTVKRKTLCEYGVLSQCFLRKTLDNEKRLMSVCTKLVVQMNAKQGGEPWGLRIPLNNVMVIGFDVYHAAGRGQSVGAMCATLTKGCSSYFSTVSVLDSREEVSHLFGADIHKCLEAYKGRNKQLPDRIFIYRDGVGEGQLNTVHTVEVDQVKSVLKLDYEKAGQPFPKLAFIVVTKKTNTRFFLETNKANLYDNPPPGTVVDSVVTLPERYDFFLISTTARHGTVSPTSYNVIYDTIGLSPDQIQVLTFKLCHGYYNWSGTVSVPAPCQYAHKLAALQGLALQGRVNPALETLLYYL